MIREIFGFVFDKKKNTVVPETLLVHTTNDIKGKTLTIASERLGIQFSIPADKIAEELI